MMIIIKIKLMLAKHELEIAHHAKCNIPLPELNSNT
jgi:hypothetical protein